MPERAMPDHVNDPYLDWWLAAATKGLCAGAKGRIRAEIEAHYVDAVKGHVAAGVHEKIAASKVVLNLGNPYDAAEDFTRAYLTKEEVKVLTTASMRASAGNTPGGMPVNVIGVVFGVAMCLFVDTVVGAAMLCASLLAPFVNTVFVPTMLRRKKWCWVLSWWYFELTLLLFVYGAAFSELSSLAWLDQAGASGIFLAAGVVFFTGAVFFSVWGAFGLRDTLRKLRDDAVALDICGFPFPSA